MQIDIHKNIYIETNPVNIPWNSDRWNTGCTHYETNKKTGRRNHGRPMKRLLDTWERNGSTSGPTPWQIYDDDDDDEINGKFIWNYRFSSRY